MVKDDDWNGHYIRWPYRKMEPSEFSILRPPTTKRYLDALKRLKEIEQEEIDRRWNLWHHVFKRRILYRILKKVVKVIGL